MVRPYDGDFHDDDDGPAPPPLSTEQLLEILVKAERHGHAEIDHHGPEHERLRGLRVKLVGTMDLFTRALHNDRILRPGQQWTIPIHMSCGMIARLIVQLDHLGSCTAPPVAPADPPPLGEIDL